MQKSGSLGFACALAFCVVAKPNVPLVRVIKNVFKKCGWEKIKNTMRWLVVSAVGLDVCMSWFVNVIYCQLMCPQALK